MEKVTGINRWWSNREHKRCVLAECRNLRWLKAFEPCLSTPGRSRHKFSSPDARLRLLKYCVTHFLGCHNDKALVSLLAGRSLCREDSDEMLPVQKPCTDIDRNMKKSLCDNFRDIGERICRIAFWEESPSVVRKRSVQYASANPFNESVKVYWPKFTDELKSNPTIFSHKLLKLLVLHRFSIKLMGQ